MTKIDVMLIVIAVLFSLYIGYATSENQPQLACGVAEISPDFTPAQKEQCRKMRSIQNINK